MDDEGNLVSNSENIAEMLKSQYESVFSSPVQAKVITDPEYFFQSSDADDQMGFQPFYSKSASTV